MDLNALNNRVAILANGDRLPLGIAVLHQMQLVGQMALQDLEWDVVYHLREVCLGRSIDREPERFLIREGFLLEDGTVEPGLRSVVLSSVRGEERQLHLDSPFTDHVDRALAEFFGSREILLAHLPRGESQQLFEKPQFDRALDLLRQPPPDNAPKLTDADTATFVRKLNERMNRSDPPGPPTPPKN
jgi:hypothetical protein